MAYKYLSGPSNSTRSGPTDLLAAAGEQEVRPQIHANARKLKNVLLFIFIQVY